MIRARIALGLFAVVVLSLTPGCRWESRSDTPGEAGSYGRPCSDRLTREVLDQSLELGILHILNNQKPEGNFHYQYDWKEKSIAREDNPVRQSGTVWALGLLYAEKPESEEIRGALIRAIDFFDNHSRVTEDGRYLIAYPGETRGDLGAVALIALGHIELLIVDRGRLPEEELRPFERRLEHLLATLVSARRNEGLFYRSYSLDDGAPFGSPTPYFDGESLLALVKAARYLGRDDLWEIVMQEAEAGYQQNVRRALEKDPDSKTTKGYYQWSSMSWFEIATSGRANGEIFGPRLIEFADWMIDVHRTLDRTRNTAYAYEGIIHAWRMAELLGDAEHVEKLGCVIEKGLEKLTSWQVGGPIPNRYIGDDGKDDPLAIGGVQNHAREAPLRIDVTQHQMHAVILARRYYFTE